MSLTLTQVPPTAEQLAVECPSCGAHAGKSCTSVWRVGCDIESVHDKRALRAKRDRGGG